MVTLLGFACFAVAIAADPEIEVKPVSLLGESLGCNTCCNTGSCSQGYKNSLPGTCCSNSNGNAVCCPTAYNGQPYHCQETSPGQFGCAPGFAQPPQQYQPPPAPAPQYTPPAPAPAPVEVCNRQTGGSCRLLSCSSSRGPTNCEGSQCVCQ